MRTCDFFMLVRSILQTYNRDSACVQLDSWSSATCHDCGQSMDEDQSCRCESCEEEFCDSCSTRYSCCSASGRRHRALSFFSTAPARLNSSIVRRWWPEARYQWLPPTLEPPRQDEAM
jgi:hypothetical protein